MLPQDSKAKTKKSYSIREIPGKGQGVIAVRRIFPGELIICEKPLIVLPWWIRHTMYPKKEMKKYLFRALDELTEEEENLFYDLCDCKVSPGEEKTEIGIWRTNNFALGRSTSKSSNGLFPSLSRFNHSCVPSAEFSWNPVLRRQEIRAIRLIEVGEEISLCYFTIAVAVQTRKERREYLQYSYGFPCDCSDCSLSDSDCDENDRLRIEVKNLGMKINELIYEWEDVSDEEDDEDNDNDDDDAKNEREISDNNFLDEYREALDLAQRRFELMTRLGFKVISRLDALKTIIDIAYDINDAEVALKYAEIGSELAPLIYGPETNDYRNWNTIVATAKRKIRENNDES